MDPTSTSLYPNNSTGPNDPAQAGSRSYFDSDAGSSITHLDSSESLMDRTGAKIKYHTLLTITYTALLCWSICIIPASKFVLANIFHLIGVWVASGTSIVFTVTMLPVSAKFSDTRLKDALVSCSKASPDVIRDTRLPPSSHVATLISTGLILLAWIFAFVFAIFQHFIYSTEADLWLTIAGTGYGSVAWIYFELSVCILCLVLSVAVAVVQALQRKYYIRMRSDLVQEHA